MTALRVTILAGVAAFAAASLATGSALAQTPPSAERVRGGMFDASDPPGLVRFMEGAGYRVTLSSDQKGDPVITGRISRSEFAIQFYECENGAFCNSVQFIAQTVRPATASFEALNTFNARWRYVRATVQDGQLRLQMDVNMDAGVTADNFEDTLDIWKQLVEIYERDLLGAR